MFWIVWLKGRAEVDREPSDLREADEVVRYARAKAKMGISAPLPDEFRIVDESGHEVARQQLSDHRHF